MEEFKKILQEKDIKPTYQRIKVLEFLTQNMNHPTVDMIYEALYDKVPTLSKTTVYNTLDIFKKNGLIDILTITGSESRYEINTESHHHFLCKKCGCIINVEFKCPYLSDDKCGEHKIEEVHGYFKGICKNCLQEE